jgi:hypothetical protein
MFVHRRRGDGASASLPNWSAGGWPFPRVPPERRASPRVLRGSSLSGTLGQQAADQRDPRACPLLRRRQFRAVLESCAGRTAHHLAVGRRTGLQPARTPLLGLSKDRPSIDMSTARPLSAEVPRKRVSPAIGPGLPLPELVPSLPFLPTSTVYSAHCLAGLLHPAADHGVRHVSGSLTVRISVRDRCTSDPMLPSGPGATGRDPRSPGRVLVCSGRPALAPSPGCLRRSPDPLCLEPALVSPPLRASGLARRCPAVLHRQAGFVHQDRECFPACCLPRDAPPFGVFPSPTAVPRHRGPMPSRRPAPLRRTVDLRCRSSLVLALAPPASRPCSVVESVAPRWPTPARRAALPPHIAQVLPSASPDTPLGLRLSQGVAS